VSRSSAWAKFTRAASLQAEAAKLFAEAVGEFDEEPASKPDAIEVTDKDRAAVRQRLRRLGHSE
jgi:hypothetical protein